MSQDLVKVGDRVRAYDFPKTTEVDAYVEGTVIEADEESFVVAVDKDTLHYETSIYGTSKFGQRTQITTAQPNMLITDWEGRLTVIEKGEL